MRPLFRLSVLALAAPLAGCFGVTAPKEVPPWAMATGTRHGEPKKPMRRTVRPRAAALDRTANGPTITGSVSAHAGGDRALAPTPSSAAPTAYTPEWFAQEHAADEQLRRQMNICRRC